MKLALVALVALSACNEEAGKFPVVVTVLGDDGQPFADVLVNFGNTLAGKTGPDGKLHARVVDKKEGDKIAVSIDPPKGYRLTTPVAAGAPTASIVLRHVNDISNRPVPVETTIKLSPLSRQYAVLVRAGVAGLPVETFGTQQAVTDDKGVAMFLYTGAPGDDLQVKLATAARPELRPQNPVSSFVLGMGADAYVVREHFTTFKAPTRKKKPTRLGPRRL